MHQHIDREKEGFYRGNSSKKEIDIQVIFPPE
jgi:hypothetical protein